MARRTDNSHSAEDKHEDFTVVRTEAAMLQRTRQYEKAIKRYNKAVDLSDSDKRCLVARSRCYLALGDTRKALGDAESSLVDDKTFCQGILRKAEAMFHKGDFEMALVFYHRGNKLRPELEPFRLGIQKATDAIENSVGTPKVVQLNTTGDLSYFEEQQQLKPKRLGAVRAGFMVRQVAAKQQVQRDFNPSQAQKRTVRHMLGELYRDKKYLEKLLQETDSSTNSGKAICDLAEEGLTFLDSRTEFWRQQKPMCARLYERNMFRKKYASAEVATDARILGQLEKIDEAQSAGKYAEALRRSLQCLDALTSYDQMPLASKVALKGQVNSCIGSAYMMLHQYSKALKHFQHDFHLARKYGITEGVSRAMDNIGRAYVKLGHFAKAIRTWERKLSMAKTVVETVWLCHEVGRCYLEMGKPRQAKYYADHGLEEAQAADEVEWQLHCTVLIAQSEAKANNLDEALDCFHKALELAEQCKDTEAGEAIQKAVDSLLEKKVQLVKKVISSGSLHGIDVPTESKVAANVQEGADNAGKDETKARKTSRGRKASRQKKMSTAAERGGEDPQHQQQRDTVQAAATSAELRKKKESSTTEVRTKVSGEAGGWEEGPGSQQ